MSVRATCDDCGAEMAAHECKPWLLRLIEREAEMTLDEYLDDDRAYSTEDDDRIPPPEEGESE